jgi:hypothetical protein
MPLAVPPHHHAAARSYRVDSEDDGKPYLVHSKEAPGRNAPSICAAVMSVCQAGQVLTSACSCQTVSTAAMDVGLVVCMHRSIAVYAGWDAHVSS